MLVQTASRTLTLALSLTLLISVGRAQTQTAEVPERAARAAFEAGVEAAEAGQYEQARDLFLRSRALLPKASTLLNLAMVDVRLGRAEEALEALDALDALAAEPGAEHLRTRANELRSELEGLTRDAKQAAPSPAQSAQPVQEPVPPPPQGSTPTVAPRPARTERAQEVATSHRLHPLRGPRAMLGVAGAIAAGAVGAGLWLQNRNGRVNRCMNQCDQPEQLERQRRAALALTWSLAGTSVALAGSGVLWLVLRKRGVEAPSLSAWGTRHGAGASLVGRF